MLFVGANDQYNSCMSEPMLDNTIANGYYRVFPGLVNVKVVVVGGWSSIGQVVVVVVLLLQ